MLKSWICMVIYMESKWGINLSVQSTVICYRLLRLSFGVNYFISIIDYLVRNLNARL
jgi:hypothetical protein